jgi:predicted peptidase
MKRVISQLGMGIMVLLLAVSCKKDTVDSPPPDDNEPIETEPAVLRPVTKEINYNCKGYYEALPARYDSTTRKYPMIIYFHGSGQIGNGASELARVLNAGLARVLAEKRFPPSFSVNKQNFSFIVIMPQFTSPPNNGTVKSFIDYIKANYRHDPARVYLSGSSMGARALTEFAAAYPTDQTAIVPLAGALFADLDQKAKRIADNRVAAWLFHNELDQSISSSESKNFVAAVNKFKPAIPARITIFPTSTSPQQHDAWTIPTNPDYRENGKSIYEWMLQYKR